MQIKTAKSSATYTKGTAMKQITTKIEKCCECPYFLAEDCQTLEDDGFKFNFNKGIHPDCPLDDAGDGCDYCTGNHVISRTNYAKMSLINGMLNVDINDTGHELNACFDINFCPMCGKRLVKSKECKL